MTKYETIRVSEHDMTTFDEILRKLGHEGFEIKGYSTFTRGGYTYHSGVFQKEAKHGT